MAAEGAPGGRGKLTKRRRGSPAYEIVPGVWVSIEEIRGEVVWLRVKSDREVRVEEEVENVADSR